MARRPVLDPRYGAPRHAAVLTVGARARVRPEPGNHFDRARSLRARGLDDRGALDATGGIGSSATRSPPTVRKLALSPSPGSARGRLSPAAPPLAPGRLECDPPNPSSGGVGTTACRPLSARLLLLEKRREVAPRPHLRNRRLDRPHPRIPAAQPAAVAVETATPRKGRRPQVLEGVVRPARFERAAQAGRRPEHSAARGAHEVLPRPSIASARRMPRSCWRSAASPGPRRVGSSRQRPAPPAAGEPGRAPRSLWPLRRGGRACARPARPWIAASSVPIP